MPPAPGRASRARPRRRAGRGAARRTGAAPVHRNRAGDPHRSSAHRRRRADSVPSAKLPATARPDSIPVADESNQRRRGGVPHLNADTDLREIEAAIKDAVVVFHPGVDFTDIWVVPRTSWSGSDMIEVWAVYDGDSRPCFAPASRKLLWDRASTRSRACGRHSADAKAAARADSSPPPRSGPWDRAHRLSRTLRRAVSTLALFQVSSEYCADELFNRTGVPHLPRREPRPSAGGLPSRETRTQNFAPVCGSAVQAVSGGLRPLGRLLHERRSVSSSIPARSPRIREADRRERRSFAALVLFRSRN